MTVRCYLPPNAWTSNRVHLSGRQAHHWVHVLRVRPGMAVVCLDGQGRQAQGNILEVTRKGITFSLEDPTSIPKPLWSLSLGLAVPGQGKLETIVNQATQMGIHRFIPLRTQRSVVRFKEDRFSRKRERLLQVAVEALRQCGSPHLLEIDPLTSWEQMLACFSRYDLVLMATVAGPHEKLSRLLAPGSFKKILLLVGPEGDFTPEEVRQGVEAGAHRIGLGPWILRCDTAVVASLAVISFLLTEGVKFPPDTLDK